MAAFAIPAAVTWMLVGAVIHSVPAVRPLVAAFSLVYAVFFGIAEASGEWWPAPGSRWQLPASWLHRRTQQTRWLVWGIVLGPGLLTRNPYAGFWLLLPIGGLSHHWWLLSIIGAVHGAARAVGIMRNMRMSIDGAHVGDWSGWLSIRTFDGLAMLLAVGALGIRAFRLV